MNSSSAEFVAQTLVNFSTIGFIIFFGTAAFIPTILELTVLRKNETELLLMYPYRLISRLGETWSIFFIMCISILFVITGGLSLAYLFANENILIDISKLFISLTLFLVFLFMVGITIYAIPIKKREIMQIIDYSKSEPHIGVAEINHESPPKALKETSSPTASKLKPPKKKSTG